MRQEVILYCGSEYSLGPTWELWTITTSANQMWQQKNAPPQRCPHPSLQIPECVTLHGKGELGLQIELGL